MAKCTELFHIEKKQSKKNLNNSGTRFLSDCGIRIRPISNFIELCYFLNIYNSQLRSAHKRNTNTSRLCRQQITGSGAGVHNDCVTWPARTCLRWTCGSSSYSHGASRLSSLKPSGMKRWNSSPTRSVIRPRIIVTYSVQLLKPYQHQLHLQGEPLSKKDF